jgi:DNA (cytosine-5)-methyltransferase 1
VQADALEFPLDGFDAIHASPPCQAFATAACDRKGDHLDLLTPTRERLRAHGAPYVIENVPNAPMPSAVVLCGSAFGLPLIRHRLFEVVPFMMIPPQCFAKRYGRATDHGPGYAPYASGSWEARWRKEVLPVVWPWMTLQESGQAIPPAYTELIGHHLLAHLEGVAA